MAHEPQQIDISIEATIVKDETSGWACVRLPGSSQRFGTGRAIRVGGTIDGHELEATLLPAGGGTHMLPIKASLRATTGKTIGDTVTIHIARRST